MPLYLCRTAEGAVAVPVKQQIAEDITRIHCAVTGAPPVFVHAFFLPMVPMVPMGPNGPSDTAPADAPAIAVRATIRAGRTDAQKADIHDQLHAAIVARTGHGPADIAVEIVDTPASWVMEGGEIFPEPGEEAPWLEAHEARMAARRSA